MVSLDRINTFLINKDISLSFMSIINHNIKENIKDQPITDLLFPNPQSIVPNLNIIIIEIDLIVQEITGRYLLFPSLLVLLIRNTPIDKTSGKDYIFAIVFLILYLTGRADFNTPRLRKVDLNHYM
jgi:hypothetical protein